MNEGSLNSAATIVTRWMVSIVFAITMVVALNADAAGNRKYENQRLELLERIKEVLVKHHLCDDKNDCSKKQLVFALPADWGIGVEVYGVHDSGALTEIANLCSAAFFSNGTEMSIRVQVFSITKEEETNRSFWNRPNPIKIDFEGAK